MTMPRLASAALALVLTATACGGTAGDNGAAGHNGAAGDGGDGKTRTVQTVLGDVDVPAKPKRVVVLWMPTVAPLTQLGVRPVGSVANASRPGGGLPEVLPDGYDAGSITQVSTIPNLEEVDLEKVASLDPDLVLGTAEPDSKPTATIRKLQAIAPTALLPWTGTGSWRAHLTDVAKAIGKEDQARTIQSAYDARVRELAGRIRPAPQETEVSIVRVQKATELRFETPKSLPGQVLDDLGFARPANQRKPDPGSDYISVSTERLADADADVLFLVLNSNNDQRPGENAAESSPLWPKLSVVRRGEAHVVDFADWGSPSYLGAERILDDVENALADS